MSDFPTSLPIVIGENVRRLRGDNSMDDLVMHGRMFGAGWSSGSIASIERGNFRPTVETLALLTFSLTALRHSEIVQRSPLSPAPQKEAEIGIKDLIKTDKTILLVPNLSVSPEALLDWLGGDNESIGAAGFLLYAQNALVDAYKDAPDRDKKMREIANDAISSIRDVSPGVARTAKKLGISPSELNRYSFSLWGKSFERHRDEVAGYDATPQKKGRVTRKLMEEIRSKL